MADITREIEITAALSSEYQEAFKAASSIARDTSRELAALTKREADLARLTEIAGKSAKASADGDAASVARLQDEYGKLAAKLGLVDKSAAGLAAEMKRVGDSKREIEALNKSALKSAELGRLAKDIQRYTAAAQRVKDPALLAQLDKMKKRFRELGGSIPDGKNAAGFFSTLKSGLASVPGPIGGVVQTLGVVREAFRTTGGKAALVVGGIAAVASAAIAAGKAMWDLGRETIAAGDQIAKTSRQLGIASDAYQELAYSVGLGGASERDFDAALRQLNKQMEAAAAGNGKAQAAFKNLGISMDEVKSMNTEEMFVRLSDALSEVDDVAAKTRTTMTLFGEQGHKVATAISGGADALAEMRAEAKRSGYVLDAKALKKAEEANDNFTRAQLQLRGVARQIGVEVMPTVNDVLVDFVTLIRDNKDDIAEFANILGGAFKYGAQGLMYAIKGVNVAVHSVIEGIVYWQNKFAEFLEWVTSGASELWDAFTALPGKIGEGLQAVWNSIRDWFADLINAVGDWVSGIGDSIASGVRDTLRDVPLVGRLFDEDDSASGVGAFAARQLSVVVNQAIDARGAEPGAETAVARAVRTGNDASGERVAEILAQYGGLTYAGASR